MFLVLPHALRDQLGLAAAAHWKVYLPVMVAGVMSMVPFLAAAGRPRRLRTVLGASVAVLLASQALLYFGDAGAVWLIGGLWAFFSAFNLLEAALPSLISRLAPPAAKGAAIGVYSTAQFLGAFAGGALGGLVYGAHGAGAVFVLTGAALALWLALAATTPPLTLFATRTVAIGRRDPQAAGRLARALSAVPGVTEAIVLAEEGVAYLTVDTRLLDERALRAALAAA
jgi:MFS family permease